MAGIFISYRRDDTRGFAGRAADDLGDAFGPDQVFRDIEIPAGSDFTEVLRRAIAACDALVVVIGRRWADPSEHGYGRRLFEPTDWVRTEIEAAFEQGKQVVPVLVEDCRMPAAEDLPESISQLTRVQAATLSDRHWDNDIEALAHRLRDLCPSLATARPRDRARREESPADVLREVFTAVAQRLPREAPSRPSPSIGRRLLVRLGRKVGGLVTLTVVAGLVYLGLRLFGDAETLRNLDVFEARLAVAWHRLLGYLGSNP